MSDTIELRDAERLSQEEFERDYYRGNRPLVIGGAVAHWQALGRWSRGYFDSLFGDRVVPIEYCQDGFMTYTALGKEANTERTQVTFREAAAEICTDDPDQRRCYLRNVSLPDYFPELLEDFEPPALIGDRERITMNHFWYGAPGCVTALHFDWTSNLLVQVQGRKHVTLFPASQTPFLYRAGNAPPREGDTIDLREHSLLDIERPDYERFPLFRQARPMTAVLEPGHMLWLPPNWWHQMRSLDVSISVNFWWTPHLDQILFMPELVDRMPAAYDTGALEDYLLRATETRDFTDLIDMAERCRELGKDCAAVLIAAAALEQHLRRLLREHGIEEQGGPRSLRGEGLNGRLAQAGVAAAADRDMQRWLLLIGQAKAMDNERLDADEVTDMLGRLRALIQTGR